MFRHLFGRHEHSTQSNARRSLRYRGKRGRRLNLESLENRVLLTNDLFAEATDLGSASEATSSGLNVGFTAEVGEPAQSGEIHSAWWKWTAPQNGTVTVDTMGSNFDTFLTLATGPAVNALTVLAQNDDHGGRPQSLVTHDVTNGVTYHIAVDGFGNVAQGAIALKLDFDAGDGGGGGPTNDQFASRINLGSAIAVNTNGSNIGATGESGEPAQSGDINSVWWQWTAPANGKLTIDTFGSNLNTFLTAAIGATVNNLTVLAQNDNADGIPQSEIVIDVTAGTAYQIAVDGFQAITGAFALNLDFDTVDGLGNDLFTNRIDLGSQPLVQTTGDNAGFTGETGEPEQSGQITSAWWQWTAPANGSVTIDTFGSVLDTFLTVATGVAVNNLTVVGQSDDVGGSLQSEVVIDVTAGTNYQVAVDGYQTSTGAIDLNIEFEAVGGLGNDFFVNRIDLASVAQVNTTGTNVGFTGEAGEPAQSGTIASAWWQWIAPANGSLTVDTLGSNFDTFLTVATGNAVNSLTVVAQNDDAEAGSQSQVVIDVTGGTRYQIAVDGFETETGAIGLNLDFDAVGSGNNDQFANRIKLGSIASVDTTGTNVGFTGESGEPPQSGAITSAWWQWTAPANGEVTIDTFGSSFDTFLTVATGVSVNALTVLEQNDDTNGSQSQVTIDVNGGTNYQIAVDGFEANTGAIDLNIDFDPVGGVNNDLFVNRIDLGSAALVDTTGSNVGFKGEVGEPLQSGAITSAWWQWTAPASGKVTIDTFGSNFDTFLTVARGSSVNALTVVGQNDDAGSSLQSQLVLDVIGGTRYQIAVDGNQTNTGAIDLNLDFDPVGGGNNDLFVNRIDLGSTALIDTTGTNVSFTGETGEPPQNGAITSAWWQWTAPANGKVTIDTFGSDFDTYLTVATGVSVNALTVVDQNDDAGGGLQSQLVLDVTGGTRYQIAVDGYETRTGAIDLNLEFDLVGGVNNDLFVNRIDLGSALQVDTTGTNVGFTGEAGEPPQSGAITSAWWQWIAPASGKVTIDTFGSGFDTFLTVARGVSVNALTVVGQNDDAGSGLQSQLILDVTGGTRYQIAVDGHQTSTGPIDLNLDFDPVGGGNNDLFVNRIDLGSAALVDTTGTNVSFTGETGEPPQNGAITSAWWQWTAPANGTLTIDTFGSDFDTYLTVATGVSVNALTVVDQNDDAGGVLQSQLILDVTGGTRYQIAVDGYETRTGAIDLNLDFDLAGGVNNDLFINRIDLGSASQVDRTGTNVNFTGEAGEPPQSGAITSAWWQWTAPASGKVTINTFGSDFDTFLTVATGVSVNALTVVGQNDDAGSGIQSQLVLDVTGGTRYQIAVDGHQKSTGAVDLNLNFDPVGGVNNDLFINRIDLGSAVQVDTTGSNVGFTGEAGEPAQSGAITSAWWQWTAPANGKVTIDTFGSSFDTFLTVATGSAVNALTVVGQNDDAGSGSQSQLVLNVSGGRRYKIAVDGQQANTGAIDLNLDFDPAGGVSNDLFVNRIDLGSALQVAASGTNVSFTGEAGEPPQSGAINSAWWQWTAPANGKVTIDTFGSNFNTFLTVATGVAINALTVVGQNNDAGSGVHSQLVLDVTGGTRYQIAVDGHQTRTGAIDLNLDFDPVGGVNNDLFINRIDLGSVLQVDTTGTNVGFTGEVGEPAQSGAITSAWWQWTAPTNGKLTIDTFGSDFDTFLTVATGVSVNALTVVGQNDDAGSGIQSQLVLDVTGGTRYQIAVDGHQKSTGAIDLNLGFDSVSGVNNDLFINRNNLGSAFLVDTTGTNVDFTGEVGEPAQHGVINSAWWQWTAPENGTVTIDTFGSDFDTYLTVATGVAVNALTVVGQNDDAGGGLHSQLVLDVTAGTSYQIAVDGYETRTGAIDLNLDFQSSGGADNDLFVDRFNLGSAAQVHTAGKNLNFSGEVGEPQQSGVINSAWWQWTAPANGTVTIDTFGSNFDTFLTVATGVAVNALTVLAQNDDSGGSQSRVVVPVTSGTRYKIAVDGYESSTGVIDLNIDFDGGSGGGGGSGRNDLFANRTSLGSVTEIRTTGRNIGFTAEAGEPAQSGVINSAWWQWTAPANGTVTVDTFGSSFDTFLTAAIGQRVNGLRVLAQNNNANGTLQSAVTFEVIAGGTYHIAVDGAGSAAGDIDLNLIWRLRRR